MIDRFARAITERDLRAKSQVARFAAVQAAEDWFQTTLPVAPLARTGANETAVDCNHMGTGRQPQRRLFGTGYDTVCTRCNGRV